MSVEVILSSRQIELDQASHSVLNIKASFTGLPASAAALYKVRTNSKDVVEVRPSFGVLRNIQEDDSIACLNILYKGKPEDVHIMKLQISWVWGDAVALKKLSHNEFSDIYSKFKQTLGKEKNHMLEFVSQESFRKEQEQESIEIHEKSRGVADNESEEEGLVEKTKTVVFRGYGEKEEATEEKLVHRVSFKVLLVGVVLAFVLGLFTGMRVENLIHPATDSAPSFQDASKCQIPSGSIEAVLPVQDVKYLLPNVPEPELQWTVYDAQGNKMQTAKTSPETAPPKDYL